MALNLPIDTWIARYPIYVWETKVRIDDAPPLSVVQDLMAGSFAGMIRGIGAFGFYRITHSLMRSTILFSTRYVIPPLDPRDDPDDDFEPTPSTRTSQYLYTTTGLDYKGQHRVRHNVIKWALDLGSSVLASFFSYPFKTWYALLIHSDSVPEIFGFGTIREFVRENGVLALYRGFGWHMLYMIISGMSSSITWACLKRIWRAVIEEVDARYPQNRQRHEHPKELISPLSAAGIVVCVSVFGSLACYPLVVLSARHRVGADPWKGSLLCGYWIQWIFPTYYY